MPNDKKSLNFKNPSKEYRGLPFWSWNGDLEKNELIHQIDVMKKMGLGGYFCHSRTGLETEYLGETWFDLINACADYGDSIGLDTWLYDEDRWPSGSAGGLVTMDEKNKRKVVKMQTFSPQAFSLNDGAFRIFAAKVQDGYLLENYRMLSSDDLSVSPDEIILAFSTEVTQNSTVYNGNTYTDTMSLETTNDFLESTHEKYKKHCGSKFGNKIKGFFTDEPHRGAMFSDFDSSESNTIPYTPKLFDEFRVRYGYSLEDKLPELFLKVPGAEVSLITWQYVELCQSLFIENFAKPIYEWCEKNKLILTGHVLHEDCLTSQSVMQGSLMRFYEYQQQPGIDVLCENNNVFWAVKQVVSVARQMGRPKVLSELYAATGWNMKFKSHKFIGDWQALFGINVRCHHLSWYTMKGQCKRDYPASILHQSAWYDDYSYVESHFARINVFMEEGKPDCDVLVISPIESVWARAYQGAFCGLAPNDAEIKKIEDNYIRVFKLLTENRIDFDYADEDILSRHGEVMEDGRIRVGKAFYRTILMAGMDTVRNSTLSLASKFSKSGGTVLYAGNVPDYVDAQKSEKAHEFNAPCIEFADIPERVKSGNEVQITDDLGNNIKTIYAQSRLCDGYRNVFLMNVDREKSYSDVLINLGTGMGVSLWDSATGAIKDVEYFTENGCVFVKKDIQAAETLLYRVDFNNQTKQPQKENFQIVSIIPGNYSYKLSEENVLPIRNAKYKLENETEFSKTSNVLSLDEKIRDSLGLEHRSGDALQPWFYKKFKQKDDHIACDVKLRYNFAISDKTIPIKLVLESLPEMKSIKINGCEITDKSSCGKWIDVCFDKINIPKEFLVCGDNTVELTYKYHNMIGVEAIYIVGDFGVNEKDSIEKLPKTMEFRDVYNQGLPYYGGKISFFIDPSKNIKFNQPDRNNRILLDCKWAAETEYTCIKIIGQQEQIVAWEPYEADITKLINNNQIEISCVLTRGRTF